MARATSCPPWAAPLSGTESPARAKTYNAANTRIDMARDHASLAVFTTGVATPHMPTPAKSDMPLIQL